MRARACVCVGVYVLSACVGAYSCVRVCDVNIVRKCARACVYARIRANLCCLFVYLHMCGVNAVRKCARACVYARVRAHLCCVFV